MARVAPLALLVALLYAVPLSASAADGTVTIVSHGARDKPVVALTFDDGWSVSNCRRILDILQRRKVAATFFPYARAVQGSPGFWRHVAEAGYPIANHSTTHPDMTTLSLAAATAEIDRARAIVERATGQGMIRVFRPPYGAWDKTVVQAARAAGFSTLLLWDTTDADTSRRSRDASMLRSALRGRNGSIVLMHCGPAATPRILERVIDGYVARGFGFVTIPQLLSGEVPASAFPPSAFVAHPAPRWVDPDARPFSLSTLDWLARHAAQPV